MTEKKCPSAELLLAFADNDLPPEQLKRVEKHLELCSPCAKRVMELHELVEDIGAPINRGDFDVSAHVASVMQRLDAPVPSAGRSRFALFGSALGLAAALALFFVARGQRDAASEGQFAARGSATPPSLSRDVGVQLYVREASLRPLQSGDRIAAAAVLSAGLRNLSSANAHLLLFAVDTNDNVHWIAPEFTVPGSNPESAVIAASATEQLLPTAVGFDDLASGPLRIVAVIGREPLRVGQIEALSPAELESERLMKRFPRAEIRQFQLEVTP